MIDEDVLRQLVRTAAEAAPPPGRPADELLEAVRSLPPRRPSTPRGRQLLAAAAAVIVIVGGAVLLAAPWSDDPGTPVAGDAAPTSLTLAPSTTTTMAPSASGGTASGAGGAGTGATGGSSAPVPGAAAPPAIADAPRVVKTGSVDLAVPAESFEATMQRLSAATIGLGGYVAESSTSETDALPSGAVTLRVPAASFDQLVEEVRKLGTTRSVASKGSDVTAQFTDLDARLRALTATRDRLYEVLRGARNIGDIIAVQDRITGVQTEIELLEGQRRLLDDQAGFGTLRVTIGPPAGRAQTSEKPDAGFRHAFEVAKHRFADSLQGLITWFGSAALALLILATMLGIGWAVWRRRRRLL